MTVNRSRWIQFVILAAIWFVVRIYFVFPHGNLLQRTTILIAHLASALLFSGCVVGSQIWIAHRKSCRVPHP
jgi:hypothetical protein